MQPFLLNPKNEAVIAHRKPYGNHGRLVFSVFFWLLTLALVGFSIEKRNDTQALVDGKNIQATIINLWLNHDSEGGDRFLAEYRFVVSMGGDTRDYINRQDVSGETYRGLAVGKKATIRYAEKDPDNSMLEEYVSWSDVQILWVVTGCCVLLSVLTVFYHAIPSWRLITALRERGQVLPGHIVSAAFKDDGEGGRVLEIAYYFTSPGGAKLGNRQRCARYDLRKALLPPQIDTPVTVLYADDRHFTLL